MNRMHPFLVFSYLYKLIIGMITPLILLLIFQRSIDANFLLFLKKPLLIFLVIGLLISIGILNWLTVKVTIERDQLKVNKLFFFQQIEETIKFKDIVNISNLNWFPGNVLGFSDINIQLEGTDADESAIVLPCIKNEDSMLLNNRYLKGNRKSSVDNFEIPLTQSIPGFVLRGLFMTLSIIIITNFISEIIQYDNNNYMSLLNLSFWIESFKEIHVEVYLYALLLFIIIILRRIFYALGFSLSINKDKGETIVNYGGFYQRETIIFTKNIKGIFIERNLLHHLFNRSAFHIETNNDVHKSVILHPFVKDDEIPKLIKFITNKTIDLNNVNWKSNGGRYPLITITLIFGILIFPLIIYSKNFLFILIIASIYILFNVYIINFLNIKYYNLLKYNILLVKKGFLIKKTYLLDQQNLNFIKKTKLPWHNKNTYNLNLNYFNKTTKRRIKLKNIILSNFNEEDY